MEAPPCLAARDNTRPWSWASVGSRSSSSRADMAAEKPGYTHNGLCVCEAGASEGRCVEKRIMRNFVDIHTTVT